MNFDRQGLAEFPIGADYVESFFRLDDPREMNMFGSEHCVGNHTINGRQYSISLTQDEGLGTVGFVSLGLRYGDDTFEDIEIECLTRNEFVKALCRTGSLARLISDTIFWPEELMTFYTIEHAVRTIAWYSKTEFYAHLEAQIRKL